MTRITNSGFEKLLAKFRRPRLETPQNSAVFVQRVMDEVATVRTERLSESEFQNALAAFRRSVDAVEEPAPSADFRHSVMGKIRVAQARSSDDEEATILNELLLIADRVGVSLCSGAIFCAGVVIGTIGLVPDVPMEKVLAILA